MGAYIKNNFYGFWGAVVLFFGTVPIFNRSLAFYLLEDLVSIAFLFAFICVLASIFLGLYGKRKGEGRLCSIPIVGGLVLFYIVAQMFAPVSLN